MVVSPIQEAFNKATQWVDDRLQDIKNSVENAVQSLVHQIEKTVETIGNELQRIGHQIDGAIRQGLGYLQTSFQSLTDRLVGLVPGALGDFLQQNVSFLTSTTNVMISNTVGIVSAASRGDLSAIEDQLRQSGRDFDDQLHAYGRLVDDNIHAVADPYVDALQATRDQVIRPALSIVRNELKEMAHKIDDQIVQRAVQQVVAEMDKLASVLPSEFEDQYLKTKAAIDDAVDTFQEARDDVRASLSQFEDEMKKAGHLIDDMKVQLIQMAAVIAVGFIPGFGPLLSIALQIALDELQGRESLTDQLLSGDFSQIDRVLIAVASAYGGSSVKSGAEAIRIITLAANLGPQAIAIAENAARAYEVYQTIQQYQKTAEALLHGDFKEFGIQFVQNTAYQFANYAAHDLSNALNNLVPQIDLSQFIAKREIINALVDGDWDEVKNQALNSISEQAGEYINLTLPDAVKNILNADDIHHLINGDLRTLEHKAQTLLGDQLQEFIGNIIPAQLNDLLSTEAIAALARGDLKQVVQQLKENVSLELDVYININLSNQIQDLLHDPLVSDLVHGNYDALQDKLTIALGDELAQQIGQLIDSPALLAAIQSGQINQIKTQAVGLLSDKAVSYLNTNLPAALTVMLDAQALGDFIVDGKLTELEQKTQQFLTNHLGEYLQTTLGPQLAALNIDAQQFNAFARGDFSGITRSLENVLVNQIKQFSDAELPQQVAQFLNQNEIRALLHGNTALIKNQLTEGLKNQLAQYQSKIQSSEIAKMAFEFKSGVEQQVAQIQENIDQATQAAQEYQQSVNQLTDTYKKSFETGLKNYIAVYQDELKLTKEDIAATLVDLKAEMAVYGNRLVSEFQENIQQKSAQLDALLLEAQDTLIANYVTPLLENKDQFQKQLDRVLIDIESHYKNKVTQANSIVNQLESSITTRLMEIKAIEVEVKVNVQQANTNLMYLNQSLGSILSKDFYDHLQEAKNQIGALENHAQNHLQELQIIFDQQQIVEYFQQLKQQASTLQASLTNAKIDAVISGVAGAINTGISTALNKDYIKSITAEHVKSLAQFQGYLDDSAIRTMVTDTGAWLKSSLNFVTGNAHDSTVYATSAKDYIIDNAGNDVIAAGGGDDYIESGVGDDRIEAGDGNDYLVGGAGNDTLSGGQGNDVYIFSTDNGQDTVRTEQSSEQSQGVDTIQFAAGITSENIWFARVGRDLQISDIGRANSMLVKDWYVDGTQPGTHALQRFATSDGKFALDTQVELLVQAMASFAPPPIGQTSLSPETRSALAPILAANWT